MIKKITIAAALLTALSATASAADSSKTSYDWTGFYIGVTAGGGNVASTLHDPEGDIICDGGACEATIDNLKYSLGGTVGLNWQYNSFVLGVEGDLSWLNGEAGKLYNDDPPGGYYVSFDQTWFGTARVRGGVALDNVLVYATGGLAYMDVEYELVDRNDCSALGSACDSNSNLGFAVGVGAEAMLGDKFSVKAEYLYLDMETLEIDENSGTEKYNATDSANMFRVGLNYRIW